MLRLCLSLLKLQDGLGETKHNAIHDNALSTFRQEDNISSSIETQTTLRKFAENLLNKNTLLSCA